MSAAAETVQRTLDSLFTDHRQTLVWRLQKMVGCAHIAEDLAHEAYLRVTAAVQERPVEFVQPFLYQTAKNLALDHLRKERIRQRVIAQEVDEEMLANVPSPLPSLEVCAGDRQRLQHLDRKIAGLPPRRREILILHKLNGWSYPRIAAHLCLSESAVQQNIRLALAHCLVDMSDNEGL